MTKLTRLSFGVILSHEHPMLIEFQLKRIPATLSRERYQCMVYLPFLALARALDVLLIAYAWKLYGCSHYPT
jgi:hypothetical protein